jgi:transcriptional regulator with XRE-family HTH domain
MIDETKLRYLREKRGMTKSELGRRIGLDAQYVYKLEHGDHTDIRTSTLLRLAVALGCRADDLLAEYDHEELTGVV